MGNGAHLVYQGPLGQILCEGASFFAFQRLVFAVTLRIIWPTFLRAI